MGTVSAPLLEVQNLQIRYRARQTVFGRARQWLKAVENVSFTLKEGETLGLVGESGCGKTTVGRALVGLVKPTGGRILFQGQDLTTLSPRQLQPYRRQLQMVFQDPQGALSPRFTVQDTVAEPLDIHKLAKNHTERRQRVLETLDAVGLSPALAARYPHELSGGQRQRVGIARALVLKPKLLILDEPLSALDVSVQAQMINLLVQLQAQHNLAFLFIAHDLAVVEHISHRILVMYSGRIVEQAVARTLTSNPRHPYTQALLSAVPVLEPSGRKRIVLTGEPPSPLHPPAGCPFHPHCPVANSPRCQYEAPPLREVAPGHWASCHLA